MAYYLYVCHDNLDAAKAKAIRAEFLQAHLKYVELNILRYAVAGPNRDGDNDFGSSTFIVIAETMQQADSLMSGDPYVSAGLYGEVRGVEFHPVAGQWVGGINWQ